MVLECRINVTQLTRKDKVSLTWTSGHKNTNGNDLTDGADMYFIGSEFFFDVSKRQLKKELQDWEAKEIVLHWRKRCEQIDQFLAK